MYLMPDNSFWIAKFPEEMGEKALHSFFWHFFDFS